MESVVRYAALVRYSEFGGCRIFGSSKCIVSTGIAVGTSTVVRYSEEVRYWEGPLSEVPLNYTAATYMEEKSVTEIRVILNTAGCGNEWRKQSRSVVQYATCHAYNEKRKSTNERKAKIELPLGHRKFQLL